MAGLYVRRRTAEEGETMVETVSVRYIVDDVDAAVAFYSGHLGFTVEMRPAPGFAMLGRGPLRLLLNAPGAGGAGQDAPDGSRPSPGGWNRVQIAVDDVASLHARLAAAGVKFRTGIVEGNGGKQALAEDPAGTLVELFQPRPREGRG
jgi:catechol 2,3-dioxygenase-like lactoylglutathione lyase family enzyme